MRLLLLLILLIPQFASAATGFTFTPPPGDISVAYLTDIFGVVDGVLHGVSSQLLGTMFGVFNAAVLSVAGVVITYILIISVVNTAHDGKVLGQKMSSIWIPIRAIVGIGAMIPKASGYSLIQIFLMWLVLQGIGAADSIWFSALNYFQRGGILIQHIKTLVTLGAANPTLVFSAGGALKSQTCMYVLHNSLQNLQQAQSSGSSPLPPVPDFTSSLVVYGTPSGLTPPCYAGDTRQGCPASGQGDDGAVMYFPGDVKYAGTSMKGACGSMSWSIFKQGGTGGENGQINFANVGAFDTRSMAVQQIVLDVQPLAYTVSQILLPTGQGQAGRALTANDLPNNGLINPATDYLSIMGPALNTQGQAAANQVRQVLTNAALSGWILAGSYYYTLTSLNQAYTNAAETKPPGTAYPSKYDPSIFNSAARNALQNLGNLNVTSCANLPSVPLAMDAFACVEYLNATKEGANSSFIPTYPTPPPGSSPNQQPWWQYMLGNAPASYITPPTWQGYTGRVSNWNNWVPSWVPSELSDLINLIPNAINGILDGLQKNIIALGQAQVTNLDPIVGISNLGFQIMSAIENLWVAGAIAAFSAGAISVVAACESIAYSFLGVLMWIVPLLTALMFELFVAGAMMAYYVPMIPLIIFLFTAIGWFVAVIESMIAGPLVALGLVSPEGDDYFGAAKHAIMLILNIFIRPTLIIFGLITGSMLANVGLWLFNASLATVLSQNILFQTSASSFIGGASGVLGAIALTLIYMSVVLAIVNRSFALIHEIPSHVLTWIGGNIRPLGEAEGYRGIEGDVGGRFGSVGGGARGALEKSVSGAHGFAKPAEKKPKPGDEKIRPS